jgi:hypothetical protein
MYLLDFDDLTIPGIKKQRDGPARQARISTEKGDIEVSAESSHQASTVGLSH